MADAKKNFVKLPKAPQLFPSNKKTPKGAPQNKLWSFAKGLGVYILIALAAVIFLASLSGGPNPSDDIPLSQVITDVKDQKVQKIEVEGEKLKVDYKEAGRVANSRKEPGSSLYQVLESSGVDPKTVTIAVKDTSWQNAWLGLLGTLIPVILTGLLLIFLLRQARDAGQGMFSFGQSRARLFNKDAPQIKFTGVAGVTEAKKELEEVVEFLKTPEKFTALGARTPKGVLLVGPAGVGKTLLARAVAGEAGVPFFSIAGSEFMEMLVGVGAARVRDMFAQAKKAAPAIIFIDEIESIGRARGSGGMGGGHDEREQTLNQILVEMDGFAPNETVIIIGATNRPDLLDPALVRPGRFDRRVVLPLPDLNERKQIIELHMKGKPFTKDVDLERIARRTVGFSGADLANMLNEAAILAAREGKKAIDPIDMEEAATKVKLGPQRKRMQSEDDRKITAYHEAGHAIVGHNLPHIDPMHKITIISRGATGGHTMFPPTEDRSYETKSRLLEQISAALGGRAAEELIFGERDITTGASNDISVATSIAKDMVMQYGMSDLGPINIKPASVFGSWRGEEGDPISDSMQAKIDAEIKKIIDTAYKQAMDLLKKNKLKLDKVADKLLDVETLDTDEFEKLAGKKKNSSKNS